MLPYFLLCCSLICCGLESSTALTLTCDDPDFTLCPGRLVSCKCQGVTTNAWRVISTTEEMEVFRVAVNDGIGATRESIFLNVSYTGTVCNIDNNEPVENRIVASRLNFTFTNHISLSCMDNVASPMTVTLQRAGSPFPPINLHSTKESDAMRLDWDPPLSNGGAITNYLIFVNMSQQVVSTDTTVTLTLNSSGQHLIQISAVNECGLVSDNVSIIVTVLDVLITTIYDGSSASETDIVSTSTESTIPTKTYARRCDAGLLTLNTGGVVGVVIALFVVITTVYTCGILTGVLVCMRRKRKPTPSASGDLSAPTYEQVLPPTQTSISLKENEAYGHLNS